jgi:DNA-binding beta-propeller fold protein YncE/thioredoxin-related protein
MRRIFAVIAVLLGLTLTAGWLVSAQQNPSGNDARFVGTTPAPEFPEGLDWINVDAPLTLSGLRGKIVILDFWTYGCINCIHMIPVLRQLEETFAEEIVVIGVHSAKFENEAQTENIRQIVRRYDLHHPVINDSDFTVWNLFGTRAWPTFVVIDPRGNIVAAQPGEVPYEAFYQYLSAMIEYYDLLGQGDIDRTPLEMALEGAGDPGTLLLFPGKVLADAANNRLFIADSNHHRIVVADLTSYEVLATIGNGTRGFADGDYASAQFDQPQGMELVGSTLYVADTNNHAIRAIDLETQQVETIAGTGIMATRLLPPGAVLDGRSADLRSPWDVALAAGSTLYIAMAGNHQIWTLNLEDGTVTPAIGSGAEAQFNDTLFRSELAQPSGLHYHDGLLYFADSESSTVRVADLQADRVQVIAGTTENSLFDFGDLDGAAGVSRLQHALGVTANEDGSQVYIADTYNSKIRLYDPQTGITSTLFGQSGNGGYRDGDASVAQFDEPGGIDYAAGRLYVADTNNHAIRVIDLASGSVSTVQFANPQALILERNPVTVLGGNAGAGTQITLPAQTATAGNGEVVLTLRLPDGYKQNDLIESSVEVSSSSAALQFSAQRFVITGESLRIPAEFSAGDAELRLRVTYYYCEAENQAFCLIDQSELLLPVSVSTDGSDNTLEIEREVIPPL